MTYALIVVLALILARATPPQDVANGVIVGRAMCAGATWLLTDRRELTALSPAGEVASILRVSGFRRDDTPWGLACLADGTLWTLAAPRTLARIAADGRLQERTDLPLPNVALFGVGGRLLFQAFPVVAGQAALQTATPRQPAAVRPWPGLVSRANVSREQEIARNLVACGIGDRQETPCWFVDASQFSIGDGARERLVDVRAPLAGVADPEAPLHDVAITAGGEWVLVGGRRPPSLQLAGVRLLHHQRHDGAWSAIDLSPAARLIVAATSTRCLVLRVDGSFAEVAVRQ
jgi:hypothetical protein